MKKFHITIKNNETGDTLIDIDTCAIIGAFDEGDGTHQLSALACNMTDLAATAAGAKITANAAISRLPKEIQKKVDNLVKGKSKKLTND